MGFLEQEDGVPLFMHSIQNLAPPFGFIETLYIK